MTKENGKPQIRFAKFKDTWEQRKVKDLCSISTGKSNTQDKDEDGEYPFFVRSPIIERSTKYLYDEEAVITVGDGVGTGKVFHYVNGKYDLHQRCYRMYDFTSELNAHYFYHVFSKLFHNRVMAMTAKTSVDSVRLEMIADMEIPLPNIDEQREIGAYLDNLDNLITLHQRKYDKLAKVKKSMLEKMFPKNGTNVPEIRFKGFTDAWEQRKLLSCIQSITDFRGRTPKKLGMDWSESGYLALSALNVKDGYIDFSQDVHYGNQELYDKWMSGKELHRGQVLFTTEAPMGNVAQVPDNKGYILSQRTIAFDVEEEILSENFLATLLRTPNVFNDLTALSSGGTAKGVSQKSLSGLDVVIPKNIDEQNKLTDYFINLDNLITLHQRKLEKLKILKKACLEKMFV